VSFGALVDEMEDASAQRRRAFFARSRMHVLVVTRRDASPLDCLARFDSLLPGSNFVFVDIATPAVADVEIDANVDALSCVFVWPRDESDGGDAAAVVHPDLARAASLSLLLRRHNVDNVWDALASLATWTDVAGGVDADPLVFLVALLAADADADVDANAGVATCEHVLGALADCGQQCVAFGVDDVNVYALNQRIRAAHSRLRGNHWFGVEQAVAMHFSSDAVEASLCCDGPAERSMTYEALLARTAAVLEVRFENAVRGCGIYARHAIKRGEVIAPVLGVIGERRNMDSGSYDIDLLGTPLRLEIEYFGNASRFMQHSCAPSADIVVLPFRREVGGGAATRNEVVLRACGDIALGAPVTVDYGWRESGRGRHNDAADGGAPACHCGAVNCRGSLVRAPPTKKMLRFIVITHHCDISIK
jgi:hypothetical protein